MWFRRDLRLADHPALSAAARAYDEVVALFVVDPRLVRASGSARLAFLGGCLDELRTATGGNLMVLAGRPDEVVAGLARRTAASAVFVTADFGPYGQKRDEAVARALGPIPLTAVGSPYAVDPGTLTTAAGTPFRVFTPYSRAWRARGWSDLLAAEPELAWAPAGSDAEATVRLIADLVSTGDGSAAGAGSGRGLRPGEAAAHGHLRDFVERLDGYAVGRDRPDLEATSRLSAYLKFGCIHPRQALAAAEGRSDDGAERFRTELAWRDFYADVLYDRPDSARADWRPDMGGIALDSGAAAHDRFEAWATGRTGYPIVDAGMRQLAGEAWMHNRLRMITASFLVKDLHLDWRWGARHFMRHLVDGDLASNSHGWQWVAGTGTDAAPYFRIFNPTTQAQRFDPEGDYVRRWIPELRSIPGPAVHEPWKLLAGAAGGYPAPIVDHDVERKETLARYGRRLDGMIPG